MEPQLSVLLYSKYSAASKRLENIIQSSGVNIPLQPVCVDNQLIRERISQNNQIQITSVPCILLIYPDGGIEKFDDAYAFKWVEDIISKVTPQRPEMSEQEQWQRQQAHEQRLRVEQEQRRQQERLQQEREREREREENKRMYEQQYEEQQYKEQYKEPRERRTPPKKHRRRRVKQRRAEPIVEPKHTSIDDLPSDEEDPAASDRYRSRKPVGSIRKGKGNYEISDEMFVGETPDMRNPRRSAVKVSRTNTQSDNNDIMAKAKALAKGREQDPPPPGHPSDRRR